MTLCQNRWSPSRTASPLILPSPSRCLAKQPVADPFPAVGGSESPGISYRIEAPQGFAVQEPDVPVLDRDHPEVKVEAELKTDSVPPGFADGLDLAETEVTYFLDLPEAFKGLRFSPLPAGRQGVHGDESADSDDQRTVHINKSPNDERWFYIPNLTARDRVHHPRLVPDPGFGTQGYHEDRRKFVRMGRGSGGNPFGKRQSKKTCQRCGKDYRGYHCENCGQEYCSWCREPMHGDRCSDAHCPGASEHCASCGLETNECVCDGPHDEGGSP